MPSPGTISAIFAHFDILMLPSIAIQISIADYPIAHRSCKCGLAIPSTRAFARTDYSVFCALSNAWLMQSRNHSI